jgi:23S rRNA (cytosine1962-C5)-methyltransferase
MEIEVLVNDWEGYRLLDSGGGRKLEAFGDVRITRSEPKAWWRPALPEAEWRKAAAIFEDGGGREGRWRFPSPGTPREWEARYSPPGRRDGAPLCLQLRFMENSKQVGLFPEQSPHWRWLAGNPPEFASAPPPALLNLFGYTGAASLVAAASGWHVTHVDASRPAIAWGRRNAGLSGLSEAPLRWVLEDAVKFVQREVRRGNRYDAILLDPPAFGRGPDGELWKIERDLPPLLENCRRLLSDRASLVLLTVYTIDASSILCHNLLRQMAEGLGGTLRIGELAHREESGGRLLPLSLWGRWERR